MCCDPNLRHEEARERRVLVAEACARCTWMDLVRAAQELGLGTDTDLSHERERIDSSPNHNNRIEKRTAFGLAIVGRDRTVADLLNAISRQRGIL